jgi:hypothetical protein
MPSEIMLQWNDGVSWDHRAYWGPNTMGWGQDGTPSGMNMGRLPPGNSWVKLVVPARAVGLEGKTVNGMAFTQKGGRVTWDQAGKGSASVDDLLNLLSRGGLSVTDTRPGATNPPAPRIKVDAALGVNVPDQAWVAEYYNNRNLEGEPVLVRNEGGGFIDRTFFGVSPAPGFVGAENYSTRWTQKLSLTNGNYRFSVTGDDGVRLYIDDELKIDQWKDQTATSYNVDVDLGPGSHDIRLEYFQGVGDAQLRLTWGLANPSCTQVVAEDHWRGEYFNNPYLLGSPVMVRDDFLDLNFNWAEKSPDWNPTSQISTCNMFADYFSARWTRKVEFLAAPYRFTVDNVDDGVRLYVDGGVPKIDRWVNSAGTATADVTFINPGVHTIVLEYYENVGPARANLSWSELLPRAPINLVASAASPSKINLSWIDNSGNEDGFKIERWNGSNYAQINAVGANVTTSADTGLTPSTTYYYRVRAYNSWGDSSYSNESSATTSACSYAVSPTSESFPQEGGYGSITVSATAGCAWSATAFSYGWITITSGQSGVGNGVVNYSVPEFTAKWTTRTGTIVVGGQIVAIEQAGIGALHDSTPTIKQTGMLLPPGSDAGPKATRPQANGWLSTSLSRAGLVLLIVCGLLTLLPRIHCKESKRTDEHGNRFRWRAKVMDIHGAQVGRLVRDAILLRDVNRSSSRLEAPDRKTGGGKIASPTFLSGIFRSGAFLVRRFSFLYPKR